MLSIKGLSFQYKNSNKEALSDVSVKVSENEAVAIMGSTGAGKSTLCLCMNGIVPHFVRGEFEGEVVVEGKNTKESSVRDLASVAGLVFQDFEAQLFSSNVELEVGFGPGNLRLTPDEIQKRISSALKIVGLEGFDKREPHTLSGGEKQRLAIASVIAMSPRMFVLDEPTTDLDPKGKSKILRIIKKLRENSNASFIIVEHETEEILNTDRLILMKDGNIIESGLTKEVLKKADVLKEVGVKPPQIVELFDSLGIDEQCFTVNEAFDFARRNNWKLKNIEDKEGKFGNAIIEAKSLNFGYEKDKGVLKDLDLSIREGEFVAIVGQNGSGKTTLAKHFNGLLKQTGGEIKTCTRKEVGFVFQNPDYQIFHDSVFDEVAFGPKISHFSEEKIQKCVEEALRSVDLWDKRDEDPFILTKGDRQKVAVASVLAMKPKVIILDEPTTGLDYNELRSMMDLVKRLNGEGHTIIMVTHCMWVVAEYAKRVVVMKEGRIVMDGATREVFSYENEFEELHLKVPPIVSLSNKLGKIALNLEEFVEALS